MRSRVVACLLQLATVDLTLRRYDTDGRRSDESGGSHTAIASVSVSAANTRSGEALMTRTAVSVRLIAGAPVALVDHARAERPGLDQV